jgi:DNA-3-methyladenine glycosylase
LKNFSACGIIKLSKSVCFGEEMILGKEFFTRPATELAPLLLGKYLCRKTQEKVIKVRITETECYFGEEDTACHAHKGKTERTEVMYGEGGRAYVYLCYGMHNMLNITTGNEGHPEAVLIRGVEGIIGPGRVTKALDIDRGLNRALLSLESGLWIEDDGYLPEYKTDVRVGIGYADPCDRDRQWRYIAIDIEK